MHARIEMSIKVGDRRIYVESDFDGDDIRRAAEGNFRALLAQVDYEFGDPDA